MAGAMEKIKAKVENVLHKDKDTTHDTTHTGTTGTHTGTTGTHTGTNLPGSTHNDPTGPHSSHTANAADPRVDSDRFGTAGNTAGAGGHGTGQYGTTDTHGTTGSGLTGTHGTTGSGLTGSHDTYGSNTHGTTGSGLTGSHGTTGHSTTHSSDPTGPHDSKLANKLDPRVDSDRVGPAGNSSSVGGYGNEQHTSGQQTYQTDGKKLPEALLEDQSRADHHSGAGLSHSSHANTGGLTGSNTHSSHTHGSDPTGPHDSHLGNKADPRVDSDRYGVAGNTAGAGGYGAGQYGTTGTHGSTGSGLTGSHGTHTGSGLTGGAPHTGSHTGSHIGSDPTGPHNTHLANQADPRVDSDRYGAAGNTTGAGGYGSTGSGLTGHNTTSSGLTGSHGTHTGAGGYGSTGSGLTGNQGYSDPSGPHDSHLGNKADPRVDSDRYGGQGNTYGTTQGSGLTGTNHPGQVGNSNANQTAGPHGSNVLNKLDPRVDSDLDGSKKVGGDRTYG
ncbi:uncharacterized protein EKO05_0004569 [Ascochyta rabiei]|uniref:Uncharacterized protein n=1 Tax=Didymella rabiei TaxID=5454 RepID=A0A162Z8H5_DIDRA|nr:uncharacterized protein EKO05_0004569 [Ascochyta rabiei]KZM20460.1 hypothetical protein ST47_g8348 [Ascochyta rabiei]UPX14077.1 hypothetical protein EKO05_0004569 [Ascochyta rabiei]